jgi:hypothetical protein
MSQGAGIRYQPRRAKYACIRFAAAIIGRGTLNRLLGLAYPAETPLRYS